MEKRIIPIFVLSIILHLLNISESATKFKIVFERGIVTNFNRTLGGGVDMKFIKINRTAFAINVSFDLYKDMNVDLMKMSGQVFKLTANDYKLYPVAMTLSVCEVSKRDLVFKWSEVHKYSNVPFCGIMKAGHYYVRNYVFNLVPPKFITGIIAGSYKIHGVVSERNKTLLFEGDLYGRIVPTVE